MLKSSSCLAKWREPEKPNDEEEKSGKFHRIRQRRD
jgi:hypothetical protein